GLAEAGWDWSGWRVASPGAVAGAIRFRRGSATLNLTRAGIAFVNSRPGANYGSNRMDCRCALRDRTRSVGGLSGKADPAEGCACKRSSTIFSDPYGHH